MAGSMDYYNANGLVNGEVPAKTQCPFWDNCGLRTDNCPSHENQNLRPHGFSCAAARGFSLIKQSKKRES